MAVGRRWLGWMLAGGLVALAGCQPIDCYDQSLELGVPPEVLGTTGMGDGALAVGAPGSAPVSSVLPSKVPPRELAKMSLPAYRIEPPDGPYMVNGEGKVHLGPAYGSVCGYPVVFRGSIG